MDCYNLDNLLGWVDMAISVDQISKLEYFRGIEDERLAGIVPLFKLKTYSKGQTIVAEGDTEPLLQFVSTGVVKIFKTSPEGKEQIIDIVRPGESFGELTLFGSGPSPYSVLALGITNDILWIHRNDLVPFLEKNWKAALNAFRAIASQARALLALVEDLSFKNVTGRVAKILLQNSAPGADGFPRLTQFEMAAMAGTAREVVGRSLKSLEDSGAIGLDRHKIIIKNKDYLRQLAGVD
jgi:CRP-like cAMP-binding protein